MHEHTPAIYLPHPNLPVQNMFLEHGFQVTFMQEDADFIVLTGGPDINPMLYGQERNPKTQISYRRDLANMLAVRQLAPHQRAIGICAGAQFLNVVMGNGSMYQHVDNHTSDHIAVDLDYTEGRTTTPKEFRVTSTHHQMMIPGTEGDVILGARMADKFYGESDKTPVRTAKITDKYDKSYVLDPEAIYYNISHPTLCYQPHPEYVDMENPMRLHFFNTIFDYMCTDEEVTACLENCGL